MNEKPQYQDLLKKPISELADMAKAHVKDENALEKKQAAFKKAHAVAGKVIAAFKIKYVEHTDGKATPKLPKGTAFRDYHKQVTGEFPNNHAEACANTFNGYVLTGLITEADYDLCALDWLESASTILNRCNNDVSASQVLEAANTLKLRPKDGAKNLREAKQALAPKKNAAQTVAETDKNGEVKVMTELTPAIASEIVRAAFDKGFHGYILAEIIAEIHHIKNRSEAIQKSSFQTMADAVDAWDASGIPTETLDVWMREVDQKRNPNVQLPVAA